MCPKAWLILIIQTGILHCCFFFIFRSKTANTDVCASSAINILWIFAKLYHSYSQQSIYHVRFVLIPLIPTDGAPAATAAKAYSI